MVLLSQLFDRLSHDPTVYAHLHYAQLSAFFTVSRRLLPLITLSAPRARYSSPVPPPRLLDLLSIQTGIPVEYVKSLWDLLGDIVVAEAEDQLMLGSSFEQRLAVLAPAHQLGAYHGCPTLSRDGSPS